MPHRSIRLIVSLAVLLLAAIGPAQDRLLWGSLKPGKYGVGFRTEIRFDESRPAINNLLEIYHLATGKSQAEVEDHFAGKGYAQLKGELADVIIEFLRPFQQRVSEITDETLNHLLDQGREKASKIASATLTQVYQRMGISGK